MALARRLDNIVAVLQESIEKSRRPGVRTIAAHEGGLNFHQEGVFGIAVIARSDWSFTSPSMPLPRMARASFAPACFQIVIRKIAPHPEQRVFLLENPQKGFRSAGVDPRSSSNRPG